MFGGRLDVARVWMLIAGACMVVAAVALLWRSDVEVAFVAATIGLVCWFLNLRVRLKKSIRPPEDDLEEEDSEDEKQ